MISPKQWKKDDQLEKLIQKIKTLHLSTLDWFAYGKVVTDVEFVKRNE